MNSSNDKILVGKIVAPQGIRGQVRVQTFTETPADLATLPIVDVKLRFVRAAGRGVAICEIDGVTDRNAAESLRGTELYIMRDALPALPDGQFYQTDLIGMQVVRGDTVLGTVDAVYNFGAGDVLDIAGGDMVPFAGADVDVVARRIVVK
ncbi:MAG: ribosome maturation factor RimM [Alphaproteobacteria bacterium]|nr:ribosome maturation factor RimM [Alphaproteobacteria bacterium]